MNYYHGGPPNLKVGDEILPPTMTNYPCASDYGAGHVHRRDRVYLTTDATAALMYAAMHPSRRGWVYEVEPQGELVPDPDCSEPGLSWEAERATIVNTRPVTQWERRQVFSALGISSKLL